jgi:hypothetical protein
MTIDSGSVTGYGDNVAQAVWDGDAVTPAEQARRDGVAATFDDISALLSNPGGFSPEVLLEMADHEMNGIDGQIREHLGDMNQRGRNLAQLNAVTEAVGGWATTHNTHGDEIDPHGSPGPDQAFDLETHVTVHYPDGTSEDMTAREALRSAGVDMSQLHQSDNQHVYLNTASIQQFQGIMTAHANSINEGAEVRQLQLQQLVSKRGQFMQLMSQMMNSLNETNKSIIGNTGR